MSRPRKPGRKTKGTRDRLVSELQAKGFKYKVAKRAVAACIDSIKGGLKRSEPVEVPGGWLVVKPARRYRAIRFGKFVDIPEHRFRITLLKKLPGPRRQRLPSPEKVDDPKKVLSHRPASISVVPHRQRYDVPSRTRGLEPGKR